MENESFRSTPTCEIEEPVVERADGRESTEDGFPRILLQAAGSDREERRVLFLALAFLFLSLLEGVLLYRLAVGESLIVYEVAPQKRLMEAER